MVTIGVDAHKHVHEALALDDSGTILGTWQGANTPDGWQQLHAWASTLPLPRQWGIEGARQYGRGLAQFLVTHNDTVFEVNAHWTAERRRSGRKSGKSDRLDAHAVAKFVRDEALTLPRVSSLAATPVLDLLVTEREAALAEATRLRNQLHHMLLQVDPEYRKHLPRLTSASGVRAVATYVTSVRDNHCKLWSSATIDGRLVRLVAVRHQAGVHGATGSVGMCTGGELDVGLIPTSPQSLQSGSAPTALPARGTAGAGC